jgi:ATP:cob(I)alamin adenosyltransferase
MDEPEVTRWSVGELAQATGVTVRTLHHYDRLGLLPPAERSHSGYRVYDRDGVERLYRILALRGLGFPLGQIGELLDADAGSLREATRARLGRAEEEIAAAEDLASRLRGVLAETEEGGSSPGELIETMEAMKMSVRMGRIYTRRGDGGETDRAGARVPKDAPAIEAGGELDELVSAIGLALSLPDVPDVHAAWLRQIQNDLFDIGAELSAPVGSRPPGAPTIDDGYVAWLEEVCDELNAGLEPLDSFILPGGGPAYAAQLQVGRAVCRRAERRVLAAGEATPTVLAYLNRLSDLLFILARSATGGEEAGWEPWSRSAPPDSPKA